MALLDSLQRWTVTETKKVKVAKVEAQEPELIGHFLNCQASNGMRRGIIEVGREGWTGQNELRISKNILQVLYFGVQAVCFNPERSEG